MSARGGSARLLERRRPEEVRRVCREWRRRGRSVAFVPTMGALHEGHLSLIRAARRSADRVVVSIFVNPLQFGPREDLARYPRPLSRDRALLRREGVDLLFRPAARDLYPPGDATRVRVAGLGEEMEGRSRPGHFEGVATVVAKLLGIVAPDTLWLGQKDGQQAALLERMCRDLQLPVRVRRGATRRDRDGVALSSRNAYLSPEERRQAVALVEGLRAARGLLARGERSASRLKSAVRRAWRRYPQVKEDYVEVVDALTLRPVARVARPVMVAVAARLGGTRLIDNFPWPDRRAEAGL